MVCRHAIERDPGSVKAHVRAGQAQLSLHSPTQAAAIFRQALGLDNANKAARVSHHLSVA